jgi:hypothetical protein
VKRIEINLAGTFADVLATLLALPSNGTEAEEIRWPRVVDSVVRENGNCDAEVKEAFRSLYEQANGRQVETQVGFIAIAPPVASFLKDKPYYVATQYEFFLEALRRIISGAWHSNSEIPPPQTFAKKQVEKNVLNDLPRIKRTRPSTCGRTVFFAPSDQYFFNYRIAATMSTRDDSFDEGNK